MAGRLPKLAVACILVMVPVVQSNSYWLHAFSNALIAVILALGLQLLLGRAGLLSLGQGAFYGIGAYTAAVLAGSWSVPFPVSLLAGAAAASAASLLLVPIVRLKGSSLAVATLGFSIIVHLVMMNEDWLTGGSVGYMDIPRPRLFGYNLGTATAFYYVCLAVAALVYLALDRLGHSRFGRAITAISQDEEAARASGIDIHLHKSKCFLVAAFAAGLAGGLYAYLSRYLNPNDFTFAKSIEVLIMVAVGGIGSLPGAALGAAFVTLAPEFLRSSGEFRMLFFGIAVVLLMGTGHAGLYGLMTGLVTRVFKLRSRFPARSAVAAPGGQEI